MTYFKFTVKIGVPFLGTLGTNGLNVYRCAWWFHSYVKSVRCKQDLKPSVRECCSMSVWCNTWSLQRKLLLWFGQILICYLFVVRCL